ncbi:hypothetical protein GA0116948_1139 [Chitinophaga costaii]|uniref:Uncharacterized protein n=1 Tax=Chitinophaga costaii TaxID=1335309 RepID=A0A1C4FAM4_9BACT|nr:hypothetical protein GA0116948_1139 [Chitinophaga costaii]
MLQHIKLLQNEIFMFAIVKNLYIAALFFSLGM